jgi:hypothetical protein
MEVSGLVLATSARRVFVGGELPPGLNRFEAFAVEFTIGQNLFYAHASGDPGDIRPQAFERRAVAIYEHASQSAD